MNFLNIMQLSFFLEAILQGMVENYPTDKQIEAKILKQH